MVVRFVLGARLLTTSVVRARVRLFRSFVRLEQKRKKQQALELQSMEKQMQLAIEAEHEQKEQARLEREKLLESKSVTIKANGRKERGERGWVKSDVNRGHALIISFSLFVFSALIFRRKISGAVLEVGAKATKEQRKKKRGFGF